MNTSDIVQILRKDNCVKHKFRGIFSADQIPSVLLEGAYIVNTDESWLPGKHWVSFYKEGGKVEYFDSYGFKPLSKFENALGENLHYNAEQIQSYFTTVCGQHCIYFLHERCSNKSMIEIINQFTENHLQNDIRVNNIINRWYHLNLNLIDEKLFHQHACHFNQSCIKKADYSFLY
jgi:hypothetical protein